ncbi:hypothetical protein C1645_830344, partial [Glomus cerebriforme]
SKISAQELANFLTYENLIPAVQTSNTVLNDETTNDQDNNNNTPANTQPPRKKKRTKI